MLAPLPVFQATIKNQKSRRRALALSEDNKEMNECQLLSAANLTHGRYAGPLRDIIEHQSAALCERRKQQARRCLSPAGHLVKSAYLRDRCAYHSHLQYPRTGRALRNFDAESLRERFGVLQYPRTGRARGNLNQQQVSSHYTALQYPHSGRAL